MDDLTVFEGLLTEFQENRKKLHEMIADLEEVKVKIDKLIPKKLDQRYRFMFEERVKTIVSMFTTLLDVRKEITRSLKDELDFRRRLADKHGDMDDIEGKIDVQALAARVEKLNKKTTETKKKANIQLVKEDETPVKLDEESKPEPDSMDILQEKK